MNGRERRVSVIIPTYNRAALVDRCIRSLRRCDIPGLEIVVVDDGGTDDTASVARAHDAVYVRQSNAGPDAARNNGFDASTGLYVAFIDSDDEWVAGGVGRLVDQLETNPDIGLIFGDSLMGNDADGFVSFVHTYGTESFFQLPHDSRPGGVRVLERRPFFLQLATRNVMFLGSMLMRREFFTAVGAFDRALCGGEDWEFFMRAAAAGPIAYSDGPPMSRYYKHDAGLSTSRDRMEEGFIRALDSVRRHATLDPVERGYVDSRIREHAFSWAWEAYDQGDFPTARKRFLWARDLGELRGREAVYLAATYLPRGLVRALRRARGVLTSGR